MTTINIPGTQVISAEPKSYIVHCGVELDRGKDGWEYHGYKPWCHFTNVLGWKRDDEDGSLFALFNPLIIEHPNSGRDRVDIRDYWFYINSVIYSSDACYKLGPMACNQDIRSEIMQWVYELEPDSNNRTDKGSYTLEPLGDTFYFRQWRNGKPLPVFCEDARTFSQYKTEAFLSGKLDKRNLY